MNEQYLIEVESKNEFETLYYNFVDESMIIPWTDYQERLHSYFDHGDCPKRFKTFKIITVLFPITLQGIMGNYWYESLSNIFL